MRLRNWCLGVAVGLVAFYLVFGNPVAASAARRKRAELFLLDNIGIGVQLHLEAGGTLPTNRITLSNSMNWDKISGISEYNHLPPATETYTVLAQPVTNPATGGFCFLVASRPDHWPKRAGRWILVVGPKYRIGDWTSNSVHRTWLDEAALSPDIRSQLANVEAPPIRSPR